MEKYFLGIDNGGTTAKVVIFDTHGRQIAAASAKLETIMPRPGYAERDMNDLWMTNAGLIRQAIEKSGVDAEQIAGVSCTGHGKGLYLWGHNNEPAYHGIVSTDTRAWEIAADMYRDGTADRVFDKICQSILACQPVCLLKWFLKNDPEVIERTKWIFSVKDYIRFMLTGEAFLEVTDFSGTGLMNIAEGRLDVSLLKEYRLEEIYDKLPELRYSTDVCGFVHEKAAALTGLKPGTPVSGGMFDIDACAIAMDVTTEDRLCVIAGTWSINEYISKAPVTNKTVRMNSLFCIPGYYLIEECSPTSASNSEWFIDRFLGEEKAAARQAGFSVYDIADSLISSVSPDDSMIVFLPFLFGSCKDDLARASFVGISGYHTKAHLLRAVYEGIVFSHRFHVDRLLLNNKKCELIRLAGGAARSPVWVQMFADILQKPIEVIEADELGALGCAMSAAVAAGEYMDYHQAARNMVKVKSRIMPRPELKAVYDKKYSVYCKVMDALGGVWADLV